MSSHLLMRLEAPLMSFGATAVDQRRPIHAWPATSMLTGLLANALGWTQAQVNDLDALQSRIRWAARIDRPGVALTDFQTVQLDKRDVAWTTRHVVEERAGGERTYDAPHLRYRDFRADASVLVGLRLDPVHDRPTLDELAHALDRPQRPLFIGRKGCPPATRIAAGIVDASDAVAAVRAASAPDGTATGPVTVYFSEGAAHVTDHFIVHLVADERRFSLDVHAGRQRVYEIPAGVSA